MRLKSFECKSQMPRAGATINSLPRTLRLCGLVSAAAVILSSLFSHGAWCQSATKVVVPAPPGGAGDIVARLLTEQVGRVQRRSMVIENRPGAGTIIGTETVARSAPDGSTLLITAPYLLIAAHLRRLSFDPLAAFDPICHLVSSPGVIAVNSTSPYRTLADLLDAARVKGRELTFAAAGPGTVHHIGFEMLRQAANVDMTFVPYPGGSPAISALLGGHVTAVLAEHAALAEYIKSGRLRAIAATARTRIDALPHLPTVAETYNHYELDFWWGLFAPAGTPNQVTSQFADSYTAAIRDPMINIRLIGHGFTPVATCRGDFAALLRKQYEHYGRVVRDANLKMD
jgi:tripartite-type tricarboxylate transporter receptor subunit TctC